ncbi:hypothetical protein BD309DRAFT_955272 [Dichomitus squalens]|nr:hypothetical protein BD309DRAFT_955272 [Dichomitus squalens]
MGRLPYGRSRWPLWLEYRPLLWTLHRISTSSKVLANVLHVNIASRLSSIVLGRLPGACELPYSSSRSRIHIHLSSDTGELSVRVRSDGNGGHMAVAQNQSLQCCPVFDSCSQMDPGSYMCAFCSIVSPFSELPATTNSEGPRSAPISET